MLENLPYFKQHLHEDLDKVNVVINQAVKSDVALISQIGTYIISAGGKRMRPVLTILSGKVLGYDEDPLYALAAMVEFIHTATLLHDDVVDESELRRGRKTANNMFGNAAAVLVGDFLYTRAFQLMVRTGNSAVIAMMADAVNLIAAGEVMQLGNMHDPDVDEPRYYRVIELKTAVLFAAACKTAGLLAGLPEARSEQLAVYGRKLGMAFQIMDDLLDYTGDEALIGKSLGDDLAEGKPTLPLIRAQQQLPAAEKQRLHAFDLSQFTRQRHGVGVFPEKRYPYAVAAFFGGGCVVGQDNRRFAGTQSLNDLFDPLNIGGSGFPFAANAPRLHDGIQGFDFRRFVHGSQRKRQLLADIASGEVVAADVWGNKQQSFSGVQSRLDMLPTVHFFKQRFNAFRSSEKGDGQFQPAFRRFAENGFDRRRLGIQSGKLHIVEHTLPVAFEQIIAQATRRIPQRV